MLTECKLKKWRQTVNTDNSRYSAVRYDDNKICQDFERSYWLANSVLVFFFFLNYTIPTYVITFFQLYSICLIVFLFFLIRRS